MVGINLFETHSLRLVCEMVPDLITEELTSNIKESGTQALLTDEMTDISNIQQQLLSSITV